MTKLGRFGADQGGAAAMIFGLALVPLAGIAGAAFDYSRAASEHSRMQLAVDATALALVREPKTSSEAALTAKALDVFRTTFQPTFGTTWTNPVITRDGRNIRVSAAGRVENTLFKLMGVQDVAISTSATAAWGQERLEVALVLDNTGSMREKIGTKVRIDELKRWAGKFVDDLKNEAAGLDDVRLSVVPFDTEVRIQPNAYRNKSWLRFDGVKSDDWTGYVVDRYQPYDMSDAKPKSGDTRYTTVEKSDYVDDVKGSDGKPIELAFVQPLVSLHAGSAYADAKATIAAMKPRGNTNVGLGLSWGLGTLTGSIPLASTPSTDDRPVRRYVVLLTDGDNTQYRVNGEKKKVYVPETENTPHPVVDPARVKKINDRTLGACATAKNPDGANVKVFTIKLLQGDEKMLRACASTPDALISQYYYDVQSESQLEKAFGDIVRSITKTRLTH